jgi:hypothetical protein
MKTIILPKLIKSTNRAPSTLLALLCATAMASGATLTQWTFNSDPPDTSTSSGTTVPAVGFGSATLIGGTTAQFAAGSPSDSGGDNSGWNTLTYPAQGTGNKSAGVQFAASTRGFSNIVVTFDLRASSSASKYYRFQYSTDGSNFVDDAVISLPVSNTFAPQTVSLSSVPGVEDNTNFAFRVVTEFESTATGTGDDVYIASALGNYGTSGTVRYDLVTVSGEPLDVGNGPPSISEIPDQVIQENTSTADLPFFIGDFETAPENLTLSASAANTNLIPASGIVFGGAGTDRTVRVTPAEDQFGSSLVTITVRDEGGLSTNETFLITVQPINAPPTVSSIPHQHALLNTPTAAIPFAVGDLETPAGNLALAIESSNPELLPATNVEFGGADADRTMILTPVAGQTGTARLTLSVQDEGGRTVSTSFVLMVVPSAEVLLFDNFRYPIGSLVTNSAFFWSTHSGTTGQLQTVTGGIQVAFFQSEDVHALLVGEPHETGAGKVLYASLKVSFNALPLAAGEYFAHFNHSSSFRARLFAATTNAADGSLRLGLGNGNSPQSIQLPVDLSLSNVYQVVIRYEVDTATATLWVNPTAETDASVTATDTTTAIPITSFSFRQASGIGNNLIEEVKVGTTFASVVGGTGVALTATRTGAGLELSWPATAADYMLQSKGAIEASWETYADQGAVQGDRKIVTINNPSGNQFFRLMKP